MLMQPIQESRRGWSRAIYTISRYRMIEVRSFTNPRKNLMAKKAKAKTNKSGKIDGRSKAARAARSAKATGIGGNGRDLHLADNGGSHATIYRRLLPHRNPVRTALASSRIS